SAKSPIDLKDYVLTYRLRMPDSIPEAGRLVLYERDGTNGSGYVIYKKTAGGSSWSLADAQWKTLAEAEFDTDILVPGATHDIRLVVSGPSIRLYVDGDL